MSISPLTIKQQKAMSDREVALMQKKIDQGILLAQERLVERSRLFHSSLVVARNGKVVELMPEEL